MDSPLHQLQIQNHTQNQQADNEIRARAGSDAGSTEWVNMRDIDLAFDHARIFADAKVKLSVKDGR
jgi:hypothetical protein